MVRQRVGVAPWRHGWSLGLLDYPRSNCSATALDQVCTRVLGDCGGAPPGTELLTSAKDQHREAARRRRPPVPGRRPAIGNTRLASELEVLLALDAAHGKQALVAALHRAVAIRRFRAVDVRPILAAGTGTPHPRPAGDALIRTCPWLRPVPWTPKRSPPSSMARWSHDQNVATGHRDATHCATVSSTARGRSGCRVAPVEVGRGAAHRTRSVDHRQDPKLDP